MLKFFIIASIFTCFFAVMFTICLSRCVCARLLQPPLLSKVIRLVSRTLASKNPPQNTAQPALLKAGLGISCLRTVTNLVPPF